MLVGAWILGKVESGEWPEQRLLDGLDSYLERDHDRSLYAKEDTRRKVLVGAWILGKVESGEWPEQRLLDGLDSYLERDHD
ncbi:hypothetical protein P2E27_13680, partial [Mannheimia haemolytica]|nr:hypothetical protein [Mannheimia haemolytica]